MKLVRNYSYDELFLRRNYTEEKFLKKLANYVDEPDKVMSITDIAEDNGLYAEDMIREMYPNFNREEVLLAIELEVEPMQNEDFGLVTDSFEYS